MHPQARALTEQAISSRRPSALVVGTIGLVLGGVGLFGCSGTATVPAASEVEIPAPPPATASSASALEPRTTRRDLLQTGDTFRGVYTCRQGESEMRLTFTRVDPSGVDAVFDFEHAPTHVKGSFRMSGTFRPADGAVDLSPTVWIDRPSGYGYAPISGHLSGDALSGKILHEWCGTFSATRVAGGAGPGSAIFD